MPLCVCLGASHCDGAFDGKSIYSSVYYMHSANLLLCGSLKAAMLNWRTMIVLLLPILPIALVSRIIWKVTRESEWKSGELTYHSFYTIELSEMTFNGDSATSLSSSYKQSLLNSRIYPTSLSSNGAYSSMNTTMISRGPSFGGTIESPTPRASTSSSSATVSMWTSRSAGCFSTSPLHTLHYATQHISSLRLRISLQDSSSLFEPFAFK
jgi:hypothetical protein